MSMIEYIEPFNAGQVFAGIGGLVFMLTFSWIMYRIYLKCIQYFDNIANLDIKYSIIQELKLDELAKKKGYNLDQELIKRDVIRKKSKSFRKRVEDELFEDWFGKDNPVKGGK